MTMGIHTTHTLVYTDNTTSKKGILIRFFAPDDVVAGIIARSYVKSLDAKRRDCRRPYTSEKGKFTLHKEEVLIQPEQ